MVSSLAIAPSALKFGQLIRGDGGEAKKVIRRLFNSRHRRVVAASIGTFRKRLKVVSVQVCRTPMRALLDSGVFPNVMNASLASKIPLSPKQTLTKNTVAKGQKTTFLGSVEEVPFSFNGTATLLNFLVV